MKRKGAVILITVFGAAVVMLMTSSSLRNARTASGRTDATGPEVYTAGYPATPSWPSYRSQPSYRAQRSYPAAPSYRATPANRPARSYWSAPAYQVLPGRQVYPSYPAEPGSFQGISPLPSVPSSPIPMTNAVENP